MKYLFYILISCLVFPSCTEVIEVDVPENTVKLVVEGQVTTEQDSSFVRLTQSVGYFDDNKPAPTVENAVVSVNGIPFTHTLNGIYKPASPFTGVTGTVYNLSISHEGKQYGSSSLLDPMFQIDTVVPIFKQREGFLEEGYTVAYLGFDKRPQVKYTYVRFGFKGFDSINDFYEGFRVLFDNKGQNPEQPIAFEIPFIRLKSKDTSLLIFRSVDEKVYRFLLALGNRSSGGPFSTPPANVPTNITGSEPALGLFAAYDVKRFRTRIP
jgi:hypothetical protein